MLSRPLSLLLFPRTRSVFIAALLAMTTGCSALTKPNEISINGETAPTVAKTAAPPAPAPPQPIQLPGSPRRVPPAPAH